MGISLAALPRLGFAEGGASYFAGFLRQGRLISAWRDRPDLIIADPLMAAHLTGKSNWLAALRSDARTTKVPLIALSSDTESRTCPIMQGCGVQCVFGSRTRRSSVSHLKR